MNFSEEMFYENYLTSDFHTNTVISRRSCLLIKMASKTVLRPIPGENTNSGSCSFRNHKFVKHQHEFNSHDMHRFVCINWNAPRQLLIIFIKFFLL